MRVIVTGASGFIGHNIVRRAPRDWDVIAVYHATSGFAAWVQAQDLPHVRPVQCDLLDEVQVAALARAAGPVDACLYLAANGDPARSAERPAWDLQLNTLALVTFLEHVRVGHCVYLSSGAVYDGLSGAVTPATPVAPRLPYAISKLAAEHYVRAFADRRHPRGSYVNARFFGAYGPYEPLRKITTRWLRAMLAGQQTFALRGDGENLIDFMHVDDAVDAFLALLTAAGFSGTVDVASGLPVTVNDVVAAMGRAVGAHIPVTHEGHTEEYIRFRSADTTMRDRFGFAPAISLEDGMRRLHRFLVKEGDGAGQPA